MVNKLIITLILAVSALFAQDTVYIASVGNNATITFKGTVKSVPLSLISASKFTGVLQPTRVAIFNGATQIDDWVYNNYRFKVNSTAITNVDSFVPVVNRLNTASVKSLKLIQEIRVVSALPANPDPTITYLVGAQTAINITGLNGNADQLYQVDATIISPGVQDNPYLRINGISTNVYDWRVAQAGSTSTSAGNAVAQINFGSNGGANSISQIRFTIDAVTGKNRTGFASYNRIGANQIVVDSETLIGFNWRDNSTNITTLNLIYASVTLNYGVGTIIRVFALRP
jgi:hypothetical protein